MNSPTATSALILITVALAGAGVSYHFTLESRFTAIEQKLDANSVALQQYQIAQDTIYSSKTEALNNLSKEVDALQSTINPLGKATREQTESLVDIRKQVTSLQESQSAQQDAQKKLADYASQIEKIKHDVQAQGTPAPVSPVPVPAPATVSAPTLISNPTTVSTPAAAAPIVAPHVSANIPLPVSPRADSAVVDLRPADMVQTPIPSVRALPVAIPVALSDTNR
jgi:hypothetical protein